MRYRIVDVFTGTPFAGNALCVVLDPCLDERMPAVAREVNLSETTFPTVTRPDAYRVRIFTPTVELPFAGHPSLGTAWVLGPGRWQQTSAGAVVVVEADKHGAVMTQPDPTIREWASDGVASALGVPGIEGAFLATAAGNRLLIAPTTANLTDARPDHAALAALSVEGDLTVICVARRLDDRTLHVRVFVPSAGVAEDPGTGSAAGPMGLIARRLWGTDMDLTIRQGDEIGRPCRIEVHAEEGALRVGGSVVACAEGRFLT